MIEVSREDELAQYLATVACQTLYWNEPLEVYREVSGLDKVIDNLTPEARDRLILEVLVFEIFCIAYNCQVFNLSDDFLEKYHSNVYKLISENDLIMQVIRSVAFTELLKEYGGKLFITKDALLEAFEKSILTVRYSQYYNVLGGVSYQTNERRLKHFKLAVAKNMFGSIPELANVTTHIHAYFDVSIEVVKDVMLKQFETTKEKLSVDTDESVPGMGKQGGGFWAALLIFVVGVPVLGILGISLIAVVNSIIVSSVADKKFQETTGEIIAVQIPQSKIEEKEHVVDEANVMAMLGVVEKVSLEELCKFNQDNTFISNEIYRFKRVGISGNVSRVSSSFSGSGYSSYVNGLNVSLGFKSNYLVDCEFNSDEYMGLIAQLDSADMVTIQGTFQYMYASGSEPPFSCSVLLSDCSFEFVQ
ncbi:MAG TPA: hypothetical protein VLB01_02150 [Thermodesulfobacteriota bacterium]|nr:hypothetical protein [Thermodesulfobacteriota bacterium]